MTAMPPHPLQALDVSPPAQAPGLLRAMLAALLASLAGVVLLGVAGWFITGAALAGAAGALAVQAFNYLVPSAGIRLAAVVRTGGRYFERLWSHEAALGVVARLRPQLFGRLAAQDPRRLRPLMLGDGVARLTGDVDVMEDAVIRAPARPAALVGGLVGVALALPAGPAPALLLALGLMGLPRLAGHVARAFVDPAAAEAGVLAARLKAQLVEHFSAAAEIAVYGLADRVSAEAMVAADLMDAARARMVRGEALLSAVLVAAGPLLAAVVAGAAALSGAPAALAAMAALAASGAAEAQAAFIRARGREAAVNSARSRLEQFTDVLPPSTAAAAAGQAEDGAGLMIAGHRLAPGARLALVGTSGSGKTRLIETLAGLRADAPESIRLDGVSVISQPFLDLAATFALAPQAPVLMAGSVEDNLRLAAPGLSEDALWAALEVACLADLVRGLPDQLGTWLGEGASRFSGGERKRLALARALLTGRPWLLLDEPTEGLDAATEAELVSRLRRWLEATGTGLIMTSHRQAPLALAEGVLRLG